MVVLGDSNFGEASHMNRSNAPAPIAEVVGVTIDVNDIELPNGFTMDLQQVPEAKIAKNRVHVVMRIRSGEDGIQRLQDLGASIIEHIVKEIGEWYIMADPEGNEFCAILRNTHFSVGDGA
jgi:predicted enzyme related to lactoylglutathione lyase